MNEQTQNQRQKEKSQLISILESLLFSTDKPMTAKGLKNFLEEACEKNDLNLSFTINEIKKALQSLKEDYQSTRRGVVLEELGGGFQIRTKAENKVFLQKTIKARPFRLSEPALEVLSLIAYNQPCIKAKVDEIRGIDCSHLIRTLMEKNLLCFDGKSDLPGKPMLYKTTSKFLEVFGLKSLRDLPSLSEIEELFPEDVENETKQTTLSDVSEAKREEFLKTYSSQEKDLEDMTETLKEIKTTTEFFEKEKKEKKASHLLSALEEGQKLAVRDLKWLDSYQKQLASETTIESCEDRSKENVKKEDVNTNYRN